MLKKPANPVLDEHVQAFHGYMLKWQKLLNLSDWRVEPGLKRTKGAMAEVGMDDDARLANYRIGVHFGAQPVTAASLEATALHELLHVRLRDLIVAAARGSDTRESVEHAVINTVEKLLMEAYGDIPEALDSKA